MTAPEPGTAAGTRYALEQKTAAARRATRRQDRCHAQPEPGTMLTIDGREVTGGLDDLDRRNRIWPLTARCEYCGERIACMDSTADWAHMSDSGGSFGRYYDHFVTDRARLRECGGAFYVRRMRFEPCGAEDCHCPHVPRHADWHQGHTGRGRWREGFTGPIRSINQVRREAAAWRDAERYDIPWEVDIRPAYPATRAYVNAWQRAADKRLGRLASERKF